MAGIIASERNNNQIVGVAYKSKIVRISHDMKVTTEFSAEMAKGIRHAWKKAGAHVINCSWGDWGDTQGGGQPIQSSALNNTIDSALLYGRGGKGVVMVFSSGNNGNINRVDYPGLVNDKNLVVGAIDQSGARAYFSSYGSSSRQLDVVAPGMYILSTVNGNGTASDDGTSFSAAFVSGVAAIMLSVNPNLTVQQVNDAINSTAQRIRTDIYTYSNVPGSTTGTYNYSGMGHGLVDAYAAVYSVAPTMIKGCNEVCYEGGAFELIKPPANTTITWTLTGPFSFSSTQDSKTTTTSGSHQLTVYRTAVSGTTGTLKAASSSTVYPIKNLTACTPPNITSSTSTVCYSGVNFSLSYYPGVQITWTVDGPFSFSNNQSSNVTSSTLTSPTVYRTGSSSSTGTLYARINGVSGSAIVQKTITPCTAPTITGPATLTVGNTGTYTVSNAPPSYSWANSNSNLTPDQNNPGKYTAAAAGTCTLSIKINNQDAAQYIVTVNSTPPPSISGPPCVALTNTTYYLSNATASSWSIYQASSNFVKVSESSNSVTIKALSLNGESVTIVPTIGIQPPTLTVPTCAPSFSITGNTSICPNSTFSISTGQSATWSYTGSFSLSTNSGVSTTVSTSAFTGHTGTLTATVANVGSVTVPIQACEAIIGPATVCNTGSSTYYLNSNLGTVYNWQVQPSNLFSINGSTTSSSVTINTSVSNGTAGIIIVVFNNNTGSYSRSITATCSKGGGSPGGYVTVYPNPADNELYVDIDATVALALLPTNVKGKLTFEVRLYDGQGKLLQQQKTKGGTVQFNVASLTDGLYYVHVYNGMNSTPEMFPVVVEH